MSPAPSTWPFGDLKMFSYGVIIADPPWYFRNYSAAGEAKNPVAHYACMSNKDMAALPVNQLAAPDCAMFMWATAPMLPDALALMAAWGFTFKSAGAWAKRSSTDQKWAFGTGYCFRSAAEFYLLGTIGKPKVLSRSIRNLIVAPTREHSRKPDQLHIDVEALYAGPRCELFARSSRPGWDSFGDEAQKFDQPSTGEDDATLPAISDQARQDIQRAGGGGPDKGTMPDQLPAGRPDRRGEPQLAL